jgi:hypothetical protein
MHEVSVHTLVVGGKNVCAWNLPSFCSFKPTFSPSISTFFGSLCGLLGPVPPVMPEVESLLSLAAPMMFFFLNSVGEFCVLGWLLSAGTRDSLAHSYPGSQN